MLVTLLIACVAMAARDCVGTLLTVAETRGRAVLAGSLDALMDLATIATTVFGAGVVIKGGLTGHALIVIAAMLVTSFFGTICWTRLASRITVQPRLDRHDP